MVLVVVDLVVVVVDTGYVGWCAFHVRRERPYLWFAIIIIYALDHYGNALRALLLLTSKHAHTYTYAPLYVCISYL